MQANVVACFNSDYARLWSCNRDIDAFFAAVNRGRITHEDSNCKKTLLIMDWDTYAPRLWMPTSGELTRSTDGYHIYFL